MRDYTANTYTTQEINRMEIAVLNTLGWELSCTHPKLFVDLLLQHGCSSHDGCDDRIRQYAYFFVEIASKDIASFDPFRPSIIASASLCTSRQLLLSNAVVWPDCCAALTQCSEHDLAQCRDLFLAWFERLQVED